MGPLKGVRVIEFGSIGPGPFCGMLLSDMGADVIRIERKGGLELGTAEHDVLLRNRRSVGVNLKTPKGCQLALSIIEKADALCEGFRPGVMEKLGLGPDVCLERNPRLVYGRITGWGQEGPLKNAAGHDINYIALSGALHAIGPKDQKPVAPLNLIGDFGGGGMLLAFGMVCALLEARQSNRGQVVDAAMTDGSALLMTMIHGLNAAGLWQDRRGVNLLDGGAHFYDTYRTADDRYIAVGAMEAQFYTGLLKMIGIQDPDFENPSDSDKWPVLKEKLAAVFRQKTRAEWCRLLEGTDTCFAPVLSMTEAPGHPHNAARKTFVDIDGVVQPAPAPRFSRTQTHIRRPPVEPGADTRLVMDELGLSEAEVDALFAEGVLQ